MTHTATASPDAGREFQQLAPLTHHLPYDMPLNHRQEGRALCGRMVSEGDSSNEPTCPTCIARLAEYEGMEP